MRALTKALLNNVARKTELPVRPADVGVLLVDDEAAILSFGIRVLERAGYRPKLASHGVEALQVARTMERLDVLVTDLMMPEMTGDELARQLREANPELKVLYVTGHSDRLFENKPLLWEGEAFIDKPFTIASIGQAIALLLYGHVAAPAPR